MRASSASAAAASGARRSTWISASPGTTCRAVPPRNTPTLACAPSPVPASSSATSGARTETALAPSSSWAATCAARPRAVTYIAPTAPRATTDAPAGPARLEPEARVGRPGALLDPRPARRAAQLLVRDDEHLDRAEPLRLVRQRDTERVRGHDHAALHVADARPAQPVAVAGHRPALRPHRVRVAEQQQRRPRPQLPARRQLVAGARDLEPARREQLAEPVRDRVDAGDVVGARIDRREPLDLLDHRRELVRELPPQFARPYHPAR